MKRYVAYDVGCIECGEASQLLGIYETEEGATEACAKAHTQNERDWRGQHEYYVECVDLDDKMTWTADNIDTIAPGQT